MSHVHHEDCADFIGDFADAGIVPFAAVCAGAGDDEFWTLGAGFFLHFFVVHPSGLCFDGIADRVEHKAGEVDGAAVAKMTAVAQVHTHELVAGLEHCHEDSHVGLCAAVGLNIGPFRSEEFLGAFDCEVLGLVHYLATAVVTLSGISLGVFVGKARAHGAHHLVAYEVLAGNQLYSATLTEMLAVDNLKDFVVSSH